MFVRCFFEIMLCSNKFIHRWFVGSNCCWNNFEKSIYTKSKIRRKSIFVFVVIDAKLLTFFLLSLLFLYKKAAPVEKGQDGRSSLLSQIQHGAAVRMEIFHNYFFLELVEMC